eukprot:8955726-Pyramimonas_sp.AAC.1
MQRPSIGALGHTTPVRELAGFTISWEAVAKKWGSRVDQSWSTWAASTNTLGTKTSEMRGSSMGSPSRSSE